MRKEQHPISFNVQREAAEMESGENLGVGTPCRRSLAQIESAGSEQDFVGPLRTSTVRTKTPSSM